MIHAAQHEERIFINDSLKMLQVSGKQVYLQIVESR